jgi:hypothetical protein
LVNQNIFNLVPYSCRSVQSAYRRFIFVIGLNQLLPSLL